jgi:hypothetical protein
MVAHKPDGEIGESVRVERRGVSAAADAQPARGTVSAHDPAVVAHEIDPDGSERIRIGSTTVRASASHAERVVSQVVEGAAPRNEDDVQQVCDTFRDKLTASGQRWGRFRIVPPMSDVDAKADGPDGEVLRVQVRRVMGPDEYASLGRAGSVTTQSTDQTAADAIRAAVDAKAKKLTTAQRNALVLLLDANRTPSFVLATVIERFRLAHGPWADRLSFQAVWIVGPTASLTYQLG